VVALEVARAAEVVDPFAGAMTAGLHLPRS
jgi:hypothetical protein